MSLTNTVIDAMRQARLAAGDLIIPITLRAISKTYLNGVNTSTPTESVAQGFVDKFTTDEIDGTVVRQDDTKIYLFNETGSVDVKVSDEVVIDGLTFQVVRAVPQFVGPLKPLIMVHARK